MHRPHRAAGKVCHPLPSIIHPPPSTPHTHFTRVHSCLIYVFTIQIQIYSYDMRIHIWHRSDLLQYTEAFWRSWIRKRLLLHHTHIHPHQRTHNYIDLTSVDRRGILAILDEETRFPKASDETLVKKLVQNNQKHINFKPVCICFVEHTCAQTNTYSHSKRANAMIIISTYSHSYIHTFTHMGNSFAHTCAYFLFYFIFYTRAHRIFNNIQIKQ